MPLYIIAALLMIALDQVVKYWAFTSLQAQHTIPLIENVFHLTYVENRGAAFSLFSQFDSRWIFVVLAVVITIAILISLSRWCWSLRAHSGMRSTAWYTALLSTCLISG